MSFTWWLGVDLHASVWICTGSSYDPHRSQIRSGQIQADPHMVHFKIHKISSFILSPCIKFVDLPGSTRINLDLPLDPGRSTPNSSWKHSIFLCQLPTSYSNLGARVAQLYLNPVSAKSHFTHNIPCLANKFLPVKQKKPSLQLQ